MVGLDIVHNKEKLQTNEHKNAVYFGNVQWLIIQIKFLSWLLRVITLLKITALKVSVTEVLWSDPYSVPFLSTVYIKPASI